VNYFKEVVCKAHLQVSDFRFKFQVSFLLGRKCAVAVSGNTLETRWTAKYFFWCHFLDLSSFFFLSLAFLSQQIVTVNLVTLFMQHNGVLQAFSSRGHRLQADERRLRN